MTRLLVLWVLLAGLGGLLLPSCTRTGDPASDPAASADLHTCPMHPDVLRDGPGSCPVCGMDLVPVRGDRAGHAHHDPSSNEDGAAVTVSPAIQQSIGVRTALVRRETLFKHLRTIGEVTVAEDEVTVVNLRLSGWVERLRVDRSGEPVRRGQILLDLYSPELVSAQEELLLARRSAGPDSPLAASARRRLELYGIAPGDVAAVKAAGEARRTLPIRSPSGGWVLDKAVVEGARVEPGTDLFRIGDLQRVWVEADVYEFDAPWVEEGQPATMDLPFQQGQVLAGQVAHIYPTLSPRTRTLKVRLEFENPGTRLKPGMFATVRIQYRRKEDVLAVPSQAVLRTGERSLVFVARGAGRFAPREVRTGLVGDRHRVEILEGLTPGEQVVVSGQFLLDSESRLQEAVQKLGAEEEAPGALETVWSCPMHPEVLQDGPGRCPHCGMDLEERPGTPEELVQVHGPEALEADESDEADQADEADPATPASGDAAP